MKKTPISDNQLGAIVSQLGINTITNSKGPTYRKLGLKDNPPSEKELFDILVQEQGMIKRPLIEKNGKYWASQKGYEEQKILEFLS